MRSVRKALEAAQAQIVAQHKQIAALQVRCKCTDLLGSYVCCCGHATRFGAPFPCLEPLPLPLPPPIPPRARALDLRVPSPSPHRPARSAAHAALMQAVLMAVIAAL